jgi:hypothetical protein
MVPDRDEVRLAPQVDAKREQALTDSLKSLRDQCRWLVGLGLVSVLGAVLKSDLFTGGARMAIVLLAAAVIVLGLLGAVTRHKGEVDQSEYLATLEALAHGARLYRNACVGLLMLAVAVMVVQLIG